MSEDAAEHLMDGSGDILAITGSHPFNLYQWRVSFAVSLPGRYHEWFRHMNSGNVLWYDLHVSSIKESTGEDVPLRWYKR